MVDVTSRQPQLLCLMAGCTPVSATTHHAEMNLANFEVEVPHRLPSPGASTAFAKILTRSDDGFEVEGVGGSKAELDVRFVNRPQQVQGAVLEGSKLFVAFSQGVGYQRVRVRFRW